MRGNSSPNLTWYDTGGSAEDSAIIATTTATLYMLRVLINTENDRYLMIFNNTSLPANGTAPDHRAFVPGLGEAMESLGPYGRKFSTGMVVALSSTRDTLTVTTGSEGFFHVGYL